MAVFHRKTHPPVPSCEQSGALQSLVSYLQQALEVYLKGRVICTFSINEKYIFFLLIEAALSILQLLFWEEENLKVVLSLILCMLCLKIMREKN